MVAHPIILTTQDEDRQIMVRGQPKQKSQSDPISSKKLGTVHTCNASHPGGIGRKIMV
jgi:hypothetical protein